MPRKRSKISPQWWDYTTLDDELIQDAAKLNENDLRQLSRPGFQVVFYDTLEEFYLAEALEYVSAWKDATPENPVGICGPIGPTEQLPLVARLVNELDLDLSSAHFWGMDEWIGDDGKAVSTDHPLSFERADRELCFDLFKHPIPEENLHFPTEDVEAFASTWEGVRCKVMQGGQGDVLENRPFGPTAQGQSCSFSARSRQAPLARQVRDKNLMTNSAESIAP